jgi:hydrogenase maturation protease
VDHVRAVADAVLYEGHLLWPYRRPPLRNRRRWTVCGVHPRGYAERTGDRWTVRAEFVLEAAPEADVEITLRFLQAVHRQVMDGDTPVDGLRRGGETFTTWDEAREREVTGGRISVRRMLTGPVRIPVAVPPGAQDEEIGAGARLRRTWGRVAGWVDASAVPLGDGAVRLRVELVNGGNATEYEDAARSAMLCAHVVASARGGAFVSSADPPDRLAAAVAACGSDGLWPVLAGRPGEHGTVLAAPVTLYDWPQVAPDGPGELRFGSEGDGLLFLGVLGIAGGERRETAAW